MYVETLHYGINSCWKYRQMVSLLAALIANEEDVPASRNIMTNLRNRRLRSFGYHNIVIVLHGQMTVIVAMVTVSSKSSTHCTPTKM